MQILRLPPDNMSYCSIDHSDQESICPERKDLDHELRIGDLSEVCNAEGFSARIQEYRPLGRLRTPSLAPHVLPCHAGDVLHFLPVLRLSGPCGGFWRPAGDLHGGVDGNH